MTRLSTRLLTVLAVMLLAGCATTVLGLGGTSWKEEVLLHDGGSIVVHRYVERGGRHEIGQKPPVKEESLSFVLPQSREHVTWKTVYAEDIGYADLRPLLLDIVGGVSYLLTDPVGCLAYNKWKRPNPPYVLFRYENRAWQQVELQQMPAALKVPNLIISSPDVKAEGRFGAFSAADVAKLNSSLRQPQYKSILREPLPAGEIGCPEMVPDGNGGWMGTGFFSRQPNYEACLNYCEANRIRPPYCLCDKYFKKGN